MSDEELITQHARTRGITDPERIAEIVADVADMRRQMQERLGVTDRVLRAIPGTDKIVLLSPEDTVEHDRHVAGLPPSDERLAKIDAFRQRFDPLYGRGSGH